MIEIVKQFIKRNLVGDKTRLRIIYKKRFGYKLNFKNPLTFNEKLQWLKIYDRRDLHTICADKLAVREYVTSKIGEKYLIPIISAVDSPHKIKRESLPDYPIIIKTNHNSGGNFIIRDKAHVEWGEIIQRSTKWLENNYYYSLGEWQYKNISPKLIIEKLLTDKHGNIPNDFKLFCFNGKVNYIQVDIDRFTDHKRNFYDCNWNLMPFTLVYENGQNIEKPNNLDKMIVLAEKLSSEFIFARVDFYSIEDQIYFGEITFHPEGGFGKFYPPKYDRLLGDRIQLPI